MPAVSIAMQPEMLCGLMFAVLCVLMLFGYPVSVTLAGTASAFVIFGYLAGGFDPGLLSAMPQRIFSIMSNEVLVAVPLFVFLGVMLERSRLAEALLDNMGRLFGTLPGGIAYSVTVVGMLLAASTGIVGATVVTMGMLSLPIMLKRGYNASFACGSIAASGTLGQIVPPSIVLVLLGDQLSVAYQSAQFARGVFAPETVSVNDLFAGALFPGLLLVGLYLIYQVSFALLRPQDVPPIPAAERRAGLDGSLAAHLASSLVAPLALIVAVLGSILAGLASPTEAAGVGAVGATMLAGYRADSSRGLPVLVGVACMAGLLALTAAFDLRVQRQTVSGLEEGAFWLAVVLSLGLAWGVVTAVLRTYAAVDDHGVPVLVSVMRSTMVISSMIFLILIGATMFSLVFRGLGGADVVEDFLHNLPGGSFAAISLVMLAMFAMGFFLDFVEIVFIVVPIVGPILLQMEIAPGEFISPVWLGVVMGINLQTSFLTPPLGYALFYLRGVAPDSVRTLDIYRGVVPFVVMQFAALLVIWFVPELATWLPSAIYGD